MENHGILKIRLEAEVKKEALNLNTTSLKSMKKQILFNNSFSISSLKKIKQNNIFSFSKNVSCHSKNNQTKSVHLAPKIENKKKGPGFFRG